MARQQELIVSSRVFELEPVIKSRQLLKIIEIERKIKHQAYLENFPDFLKRCGNQAQSELPQSAPLRLSKKFFVLNTTSSASNNGGCNSLHNQQENINPKDSARAWSNVIAGGPITANHRKTLMSTYNTEAAAAARFKLLKTPITDHHPQHFDPLDSNPESKTLNVLTYYRIPGPELVNKSSPSCGLPYAWSEKHDRFIAYLATHAPLIDGKIPSHEMCKPRYTAEDISSMLLARFPELSRGRIKVDIIERRLHLLDYCENDFFRVEYGAYGDFEWAYGI